MCKHVAATLYGIGARLDAAPELLFTLRQVDAQDLIARAVEPPVQKTPGAGRILDPSKLADVFGIDLGEAEPRLSDKSASTMQPSPAARQATAKTKAKAKGRRARQGGSA
jgi:uncharacterized Zn finger protein